MIKPENSSIWYIIYWWPNTIVYYYIIKPGEWKFFIYSYWEKIDIYCSNQQEKIWTGLKWQTTKYKGETFLFPLYNLWNNTANLNKTAFWYSKCFLVYWVVPPNNQHTFLFDVAIALLKWAAFLTKFIGNHIIMGSGKCKFYALLPCHISSNLGIPYYSF